MLLPSHIWHLSDQTKAGPTTVILAGTHGDELGGIDTVRQLLKRLGLLNKPSGTFHVKGVNGNLYLGFGNPEAILRNTRSASDGLNLNRSFSISELDKAPSVHDREDLKRARELAPLLQQTDFLFDLHCTSTPSEPFVCFGDETPKRQELCDLIPVKYVITDPDRKYTRLEGLSELATTDEYVHINGGVGLCYETGWSKDISHTDHVMAIVLKLLNHVGAIDDTFSKQFGSLPIIDHYDEQHVYAIEEVIEAKHDGFEYAPRIGYGWTNLSKGQLIGHYPNQEPEFSPSTAIGVFPSASERVIKGKKLIVLAKLIN